MNNIITVENLGKKYTIGHQGLFHNNTFRETLTGLFKKNIKTEEFWALKDVAFEVKHGDRVGIIGRNGAGKSTLLKILSRITHPTTGRVHIKGRVSSLLEVGTGFHPELTGRENIYLNGAVLGMTRNDIKQRFDEIVAFSEIEKFLDTPAKRYSSGMYVRLAFAVAAHLEPEILIVDEGLAVGDAEFRKKCLGKMRDVGKEGRTVILVSHSMPSIKNLCSKVLILDRGRKVMAGRYIFSFRLAVDGVESDSVLGSAPGFFDVIDGDYFKTSKISNFAPVIVDHSWKISNSVHEKSV